MRKTVTINDFNELVSNALAWDYLGMFMVYKVLGYSNAIILAISIVWILLCSILLFETKVHSKSSIIGLFPTMIITIFCFGSEKKYLFIMLLFGLLILTYSVVLYFSNRDIFVKRKKKYLFYVMKTSVILFTLMITVLVGIKWVSIKRTEISYTHLSKESVLEELDNWEVKNFNQRLEALSVLTAYEGHEKMRLPFEPKLYGAKLSESRGTFTTIMPDSIFIDATFVEEATVQECCLTIFHELHHLERYHVIQMLDEIPDIYELESFEEEKAWKTSYENYIDSEESYESYRIQVVEKTAREYAEERLFDFFAESKK